MLPKHAHATRQPRKLLNYESGIIGV
jgi:hypothetical protein